MSVKYCNAVCQKKHWATHKKQCKRRAAELRDEALFKDPPPLEDCQICFLPMPEHLICCFSLPPTTITSVPIFDFAHANAEIANEPTEIYYPCCGKSICRGCVYSFGQSGNASKCPFCNADRNKTREENNEDLMKRVAVNDPASICVLANQYQHGLNGFQQDHLKAIEQYTRAADRGYKKAHHHLGMLYHEGGDMKKAKFHYEAAAMAGNEVARCIIGIIENDSGNMEQSVKHLTIAASAGDYGAMNQLRLYFEKGQLSRESIDSVLTAYNSSCVEMRSEARDASIRAMTENGL
jgi:hypothetical protein